MMRSLGWLALCAWALTACIDDQGGGSPAADDERGDATAERDGAVDEDAGDAATGPVGDPDAAPRPPDARVEPDAAPPPDAAVDPGPVEDLCGAYCDKVEACVLPVCPALAEGGGRELCRGGCRQPEDALRAQIALECEAFVERLFRQAPMLETFCSDEPPPPECPDICGRAAECGIPGGPEACIGLCRTVGEEQRRCLTGAGSCEELVACVQGGPQQPDPREACNNRCGRRARCVLDRCAPGALADGFVGACVNACVDDPPDREAFESEQQSSCDEVVATLRASDPLLDDRCDNAPEEACVVLCDAVSACDLAGPDECAMACAGWDEANLLCLQIAPDCDAIAGCFGDPEGQALCDRICTRVQGCLEEACPPRVLPPELSVACTAGCLDDPPASDDVEALEAATCAEVRQTVYRRNPQLRPVCEGGRDFRPSPEECVAFCDEALGACVGVGGRNFCLAGCASLTLDQYACALEAQGDCMGIAACLEPAP